ncbi:MAG: hypothetical protein SF162_17080 [bacterium]|nr:hypothetical protein [bacterium]
MPNAIYRNLDGSIGQDITDLGNSFVSATIASGVITYTGTLMSVDTEGGAALDDLVTIANGGTGKLLLLRCQSPFRRVILKHGLGNLYSGAGDVLLDDPNQIVMLIYNGQSWAVINGGEAAGSSLALDPDACGICFADFTTPVIGSASVVFPSASRPFGLFVPTTGGMGGLVQGRNTPECAQSIQVSNGSVTVRECTIIVDYGVTAPCAINRVRFWVRGVTSDPTTLTQVSVRFFGADQAQIGTTQLLYDGAIRQYWNQAVWTGSVSGVRYVAMTIWADTTGLPHVYIDEIEVN